LSSGGGSRDPEGGVEMVMVVVEVIAAIDVLGDGIRGFVVVAGVAVVGAVSCD